MKSPLLLILLILFFVKGCGVDEFFEEELMIDFKVFQRIIEENPEQLKGQYFDIADGYHWIVESNFGRLFSFTDLEFQNRFINLFRKGEITRIEVWDQKCIQFRIRPNYNNSLIKLEWEELWIIYNSGCDCVCHKRINQIDVPEENITLIEKNWYKVISKNKRYIGG